jgi:hypothetical protein
LLKLKNHSSLHLAMSFAKKFQNQRPILEEFSSEESERFRNAMEGKIPPVIEFLHESFKRYVRLYQCSFSKGFFSVERVADFCQSDLEISEAYVLDGYERVFLWIGPVCTDSLAAEASHLAQNYCHLASSERDLTIELEVCVSFMLIKVSMIYFITRLLKRGENHHFFKAILLDGKILYQKETSPIQVTLTNHQRGALLK